MPSGDGRSVVRTLPEHSVVIAGQTHGIGASDQSAQAVMTAHCMRTHAPQAMSREKIEHQVIVK
jgi:hypothetical protein